MLEGEQFSDFWSREKLLWWEVFPRIRTVDLIGLEKAWKVGDELGFDNHESKVELIGRVLGWISGKEIRANATIETLTDILMKMSKEEVISSEENDWIVGEFYFKDIPKITHDLVDTLIEQTRFRCDRYKRVIDGLILNDSLFQLASFGRDEIEIIDKLEKFLGDSETDKALKLENKIGITFDQVYLIKSFWRRIERISSILGQGDILDLQQNMFNFNLN